MLESTPVIIIVGTILGFLSGLGIGGGSLLIVWLTAILNVDPLTARSINLLFFIPAAVITCVFRLRQKTVSLKKILPAILAGCIAAIAFSMISTVLDEHILKKIFGIILLAAGLREVFYRRRNAK